MKLIISATSRFDFICTGRLTGVIKRIGEHCGTDAEAVAVKVKELAEVAFAFESQSEMVGDYRITQEMRGGSPWYEVSRRIIVTPAETIAVADATEAMAICKARSPEHPVYKTEGGKRNRIDATGKLYTCGTAPGCGFSDDVIASSVPVIAFFRSHVLHAALF